MPINELRAEQQQPANNHITTFFSFFGTGTVKERLSMLAVGGATITYQFIKTARNSYLNYITSYIKGCEDGANVANHPDQLAAIKFDPSKLPKPTPHLHPYIPGACSAFLYLTLLAAVFRFGELYGLTGKTLYRDMAFLAVAMLLTGELFNKFLDEGSQAANGKYQGFYDCSQKYTPRFHKAAPYPVYIEEAYLALIFTFAAMSMGAFAVGAISGNAAARQNRHQ